MEKYSIDDVAKFTGLTTRTLRNYIKMNILPGEKIDGIWRFTDEDISVFFADLSVKASIRAKERAVIFDFLNKDKKSENAICMILDLHLEERLADDVSKFFTDTINSNKYEKLEFRYEREGEYARITLSGREYDVIALVNAYYNSFANSLPNNI